MRRVRELLCQHGALPAEGLSPNPFLTPAWPCRLRFIPVPPLLAPHQPAGAGTPCPRGVKNPPRGIGHPPGTAGTHPASARGGPKEICGVSSFLQPQSCPKTRRC